MPQHLTIAHLSDTHLGYRSFSKEDPRTGVNQREVDVYQAFAKALQAIQESSPDLILITGDLFDKKVPSMWSLRRAFRALRMVQERRQGKPLIILGGNHDTPRSRESSAVFPLFEEIPGIKAVYGVPDRVILPELGACVMCVPAASATRLLNESLKLEPDKQSAFNILAVHGVLQGVQTYDYAPFFLPRSSVLDERWDYIALGDYHDFQLLAPNAAYAGATEFTTANIWSEGSKKGWVWVEIEKEKPPVIQHREVPTRRVISLPDVDILRCPSANEAVEQVLAQAKKYGVKDAIVRVRLLNLPHAERAKVYRAIVEGMKDAFYVRVDFRTPPRLTSPGGAQVSQTGVILPVEERWRHFVASRESQLPRGVSVEEVIQRGLEALQAAGEEV